VSKEFSIIDDSLKTGLSLNHLLVVKFSGENISFAVLDTTSNTFVAFEKRSINYFKNFAGETTKPDILKMFTENGMGKSGKAIVLIDNPVFTLVPDELFSEHDKKKYLLFTHAFQKNEKIAIDNLSIIHSKNVYWIPQLVREFVDKYFVYYESKHFASVFLNFCLLRNSNQPSVYVYVGENVFYIIVMKDTKLLLCNAYEYCTNEDFVFFIMNVFKKLQFDPQTASLFIMGDIENLAEFKTTISKYIAKVEFLSRPKEYNYCKGILDMPSYFSNILFGTFLCV
jgi:hypothetical protein